MKIAPSLNQFENIIMYASIEDFKDLVGSNPSVGLTFWIGNNLRQVDTIENETVKHSLVSKEIDFLA